MQDIEDVYKLTILTDKTISIYVHLDAYRQKNNKQRIEII